jgi:hypothetical protein
VTFFAVRQLAKGPPHPVGRVGHAPRTRDASLFRQKSVLDLAARDPRVLQGGFRNCPNFRFASGNLWLGPRV